MTDEIEKVIAAYFDKHDPHPDLDAEAANLVSHLHAAGWEIVPTWSDNLSAAPRDVTPFLGELQGGVIKVCWFRKGQSDLRKFCWLDNGRDGPFEDVIKRWKPIIPPESD